MGGGDVAQYLIAIEYTIPSVGGAIDLDGHNPAWAVSAIAIIVTSATVIDTVATMQHIAIDQTANHVIQQRID